ncbi:MAG: nitroreductase [Cellvibrionaceae bacterium]|nr:nitroreductase [Cellvibrionaceae bacterium]MCV6627938.1 nitroreductase [Cellvibrionaceae bacterium]
MSEPCTDLFELLQRRYSVRAFTEQVIEPELLEKIFSQAQQAPSNCNTQPWQAYVISGERCRRFAVQLSEAVAAGAPSLPDYEVTLGFFDEYRQRQVDCAFALYNSMGIERSDKLGRGAAMLRNFEFFGAPHVVFVAMPKTFGMVNALDVGIWLQTLNLVMESHGIGSCIQGALAYYPDLVRKELGLPEDDSMQILCGISFGYEDQDAAPNKTRTVRAPLAENISFFN